MKDAELQLKCNCQKLLTVSNSLIGRDTQDSDAIARALRKADQIAKASHVVQRKWIDAVSSQEAAVLV